MKEKAIVAIDPSLTNTAVYAGNVDHSDHMCFGSKACGTLVSQRITRYINQVEEVRCFLLEAVGAREVAVYIEGYSFNSRIGGEHLGEYGGLLREMLLDFTSRVIEVAPATLKKFATGKGAGPKDLVAAHLTKRYGVLLNSNDEYDAYGLYRLGLVAEGFEEPATQAQREAADTVLGLKPKPKKKRKQLTADE